MITELHTYTSCNWLFLLWLFTKKKPTSTSKRELSYSYQYIKYLVASFTVNKSSAMFFILASCSFYASRQETTSRYLTDREYPVTIPECSGRRGRKDEMHSFRRPADDRVLVERLPLCSSDMPPVYIHKHIQLLWWPPSQRLQISQRYIRLLLTGKYPTVNPDSAVLSHVMWV